ncbi:MAG: response regulator transcription factor [Umezawaea sp.]
MIESEHYAVEARVRPVLVVEDEPGLRELITRTLSFAGFRVLAAADLAGARQHVESGDVAVGVLDVMLPDGSGFDLAQDMRSSRPGVGILFLTARDTLEDRLTGFALGADDYLTKPFAVAELAARVGALHRRVVTAVPVAGPEPEVVAAPASVTQTGPEPSRQASPATHVVADVELDDAAHTVTRAGQRLDLSPTEYKLLRYLMQNADMVVSRQQIVAQVWNYDHIGDVGVVEKFISQLRRKLGASSIETVRGFGYTMRSR